MEKDIYYTNTNMTRYIHKMFLNSFEKQWYETYWAIDLHGTVMESTYRDNDSVINYYPYAKEALQLLSKRGDIVLIISTSTHPDIVDEYQEQFKKDGINFKFVNCNPDITSRNGNFGYYKDKFYFNIVLEDKGAFDPLIEWESIKNLLEYYNTCGHLPKKEWTTKF